MELRGIQPRRVRIEEGPGRLGRRSGGVVDDPVVAEIRHPERPVRGDRQVAVGEGLRRAVVHDVERVQVHGLEPAVGLGKPDLAVGREVEAGRDGSRRDPLAKLTGRRVQPREDRAPRVDQALAVLDEPDDVAVDLEVHRVRPDVLVVPDLPLLHRHAVALELDDPVVGRHEEPDGPVGLGLDPHAADGLGVLDREQRAGRDGRGGLGPERRAEEETEKERESAAPIGHRAIITQRPAVAFPIRLRGYPLRTDGFHVRDRADSRPPHRGGRAGARRASARRAPALLLVRPPLSDPGGARGRLPRALQRGGAARALGLRRRPPVRPDREEALLPRAARIRRALLRHARLRPALRLLPELVHVAVDPRPAGDRAAPRRLARDARRPRAGKRRADRRLDLQRAAHHLRVGRRRLPGGEAPRPLHRRTSPTATARRKCSTTSGPGSTSTRWT